MCWFAEPVTMIRIGLILGVILCVVGLKVTGG
jgi:quaternary ammonium compound-resistance protein SugE